VEAAFKYMVLSSIGALFFLLAIGLLYAQYNALNIAAIASVLTLSFLDKIALVLLVVVLAMKAGLAPMHMWLPDAYGRAPPSVTVAIIAATLASFYGILRVVFTLYGGTLAEPLKVSVPLSVILGALFMVLAMATIVVGVFMALVQTDLMRVIGYAAVAELGYIFLAVGAGLGGMGTALADTSRTALAGGLFHIFNDALDISLLFLVAGSVFFATKRRSLDELGGLARTMKWTTVFFLVGLLAVSGMPPLNGFSSKLLIYESVYRLNPILSIVAILGSILLLAVFVKVLYAVFLGPEVPDLRQTKEVPRSMLAAMGIVASLAVVVGLFPTVVLDTLVTPAVDALLDSAQYLAAVGVV
jgi:multicomponent Na+:H+ antiporter subunit D